VRNLQLGVVGRVGYGGVGVDFEVGLIWNLGSWWFEVESFEVREREKS